MAEVKWPVISENAITVLEKRYLLKDAGGRPVETPDQMFRRVARNVSSANKHHRDGRGREEEDEFFAMMRGLEFLPNSPALMNAGTELQQLAACFVLPVEDSIEGIYDAVKFAAMIHQSGGGTGFSFSRLRPSGDLVRSTMGIASGPVSFMKVFDAATEAIKQGGRRRGASMGILRVDHPDIESFTHCKDDLTTLSNFNISVGSTDEFMDRSVEGGEYELINPRTGKAMAKRNASAVLDDICSTAWRTGDPGMVFLDTINRGNPTPGLGNIEATNPCGEVPLLPFEACNLGSINLDAMLIEDKHECELDWQRLSETVDRAVRFLDNMIDVSRYPLPQISEVVSGNRKIGLGVMGFADALIRLRLAYGSDGSMAFAAKLIAFIRQRAEETSARIAKDRGDFPNIDKSVRRSPRRNASVLSIAPTGTISMIAGCSSGIEPLYALSYVKHVMEGSHLREVHPLFLRVAKERGFFSEDLTPLLLRSHSVRDHHFIPEDVRGLFLTAYDVSPDQHVRMQSVFQASVDNAVSKTINLPPDATPEDVRHIYVLAHQLGCKGITVYREGSKSGQVLTAGMLQGSCPNCGSALRVEEGVLVCPACGFTQAY